MTLECKTSNDFESGVNLFNKDAKKGIRLLISKHLLKDHPRYIAMFLMSKDLLNKAKIGEYLGDPLKENQETLQEYVKLQNFKRMCIVQALRDFLWNFRLPGILGFKLQFGSHQ